MTPRYCRLLLIIATCAALAGCMGTTKKEVLRYYLIEPDNAVASSNKTDISIEIRELSIPQYLDRFQIVTRTDTNRLRLAEFHQWGENLRENLIHTTVRYLARELGPEHISSPLEHAQVDVDYQLDIYIEQFELTADGLITLEARWKIIETENRSLVDSHHFIYKSQQKLAADNYDDIVQDMQLLFNQLCRELAQKLYVLA